MSHNVPFMPCPSCESTFYIQQYKIIPFLKLMLTHISPWLWIAFHASSQLYRLTSYYFSCRVLLLASTIPISFPYLTHTQRQAWVCRVWRWTSLHTRNSTPECRSLCYIYEFNISDKFQMFYISSSSSSFSLSMPLSPPPLSSPSA